MKMHHMKACVIALLLGSSSLAVAQTSPSTSAGSAGALGTNTGVGATPGISGQGAAGPGGTSGASSGRYGSGSQVGTSTSTSGALMPGGTSATGSGTMGPQLEA